MSKLDNYANATINVSVRASFPWNFYLWRIECLVVNKSLDGLIIAGFGSR